MTGVGIDFGTSNSAAAWFDGENVRMVQLEALDEIMPTATHLDRDLAVKTGNAAVLQYIEENRNRVVELTSEVIAKTAVVTGGGGEDGTPRIWPGHDGPWFARQALSWGKASAGGRACQTVDGV